MTEKKEKYRVGVISDTHGMLRPEVPEILHGVDLILHAGDVGKMEILHELKKTAPVVAVQGNMDGRRAAHLKGTEIAEIGEIQIYMLHDLWLLDLEPATAGFHAVVSGHTHQPKMEEKNGVLYLNPGSAGPRRFDYPISLALLEVRGKRMKAEIIEIGA